MNLQSNGVVKLLRRILLAALGATFLLHDAPARAQVQADAGTSFIEVTFTADKKFIVRGEETTLGKLPAQLKSAGATHATAVRVCVDDSTPEVTMKAIAGKLKSAGYSRILFARPRRAEASVASNAPSLPPPPKRR